jgi:hypothetical protein
VLDIVWGNARTVEMIGYPSREGEEVIEVAAAQGQT